MSCFLFASCARVDPSKALQEHLASGSLDTVAAQDWASSPMSSAAAATVVDLVHNAHIDQLRDDRAAELSDLSLLHDEHELRLWYRTFGDAPAGRRSLYISLHGGGGAAPEVNDQQWRNQQQLYTLDEGVYVAPRAPSDTWNMWHRSEMDWFVDRLLEDMVALEGVDPDRVYLTGYSAGGDGVYQLGTHLADRFAAANANAGHPNKADPVSMRNMPFTVHVGGLDTAYDRAAVAAEWGVKLDELQRADPGGYVHDVQVHDGLPHWMNGAEKVAMPWMAQFTRDSHPDRVVWKVRGARSGQRFYWLGLDDPQAHDGAVIIGTIDGQTVRITTSSEAPVTGVRLWLSDDLLNLDDEVVVTIDGVTVFEGVAERTVANVVTSLHTPGASFVLWPAQIDLP